MKKTLLVLVTLFMCINIKALDLELNSKYAYVYNLTEDKVMYQLNYNKEVKVASMTKIMTAIIVIENNKNLDKTITIKDEDLKDMYEYTTTGFQAGDEVTIKELLYGILLKSGSDAVNAAVRITTETEEEFVNLMNEKVKELNLTHTHFSNPIGKDKDNYSSVHDIAKIMRYCLKNKLFKEIISTNKYYIDRLDLQINGPLYKMDTKYDIDLSLIKGGKNGYTSLAKYSLVSYGEKDGVTYIVVTDCADRYKEILEDTAHIYEYFFDNYSYIDYKVNFNIPIKNGKEKEYNIDINTKLYLQKDYEKDLLTYEYTGKNKISVLDVKGSKIGKINIYYDNELIKQVDVKIKKDIEYKTHIYIWFILGIITTITIFIVIIKFVFINKKYKKNNKKSIAQKNQELENQHNKIKQFIKEEYSEEKNKTILKNTTDINLFFDTIKNIDNIDKISLEHDFIDRCFKNIDFTKEENLKELYIKLKLYKNEMSEETLKYCKKLFKYCVQNYINKN